MASNKYQMSNQASFDASHALSQSAINGVLSIAHALHSNGTLTSDQIRSIYNAMNKPLSHPPLAGNPAVQSGQQRIDAAFAVILRQRR